MRESPLKAKKWDPAHEKALFDKWKASGAWGRPAAKEGRVWVVDTPPPYPSGRIHIGSAIHYSQIDMIARSFRMIDCQVTTEHLIRFGAKKIPRATFLNILSESLQTPTIRGMWRFSS